MSKAKSWASLVAGKEDKEQVENGAGTAPTGAAGAIKVLKRQPSKSIANEVEEKKLKAEEEDAPLTEAQKEHRLKQRYKQIEIGKQTMGYELYVQNVPKTQRKHRDESHPVTPDHKQTCSKRSWDGQIKVWRRRLHLWTPATAESDKPANEELKSSTSGFYEAEEEGATPSFSSFSSRPLPEVVAVSVEPMQLGNGENSLLGQWAANSNSARPMELQGDSCVPGGPQKDDGDELLFIPFQFE